MTYINIHVYLNENISNNVEKLHYYIIGICLAKVEKMETKGLLLWKITLSKDLTLFFNNVTGYPSVKRWYLGSLS